MNAYDVASKMRWDIRCDTWAAVPVAQRWFATGEALAHLRFLEDAGDLAGEKINGTTVYGICRAM